MDPPGSSAVRWRARSNNADPFHSAKATTSTPPTSRAAAAGSSTGSPAVAIAVAQAAEKEGLAQADVSDLVQQVHQAMWRPAYPAIEAI